MEPKIITQNKLFITGITGDGADTGKLWNDFDIQYNSNPFPRIDKNNYEVRFFDDDKNIHVGLATENIGDFDVYKTIILPESDYVVFDVFIANGYDSRNSEMDKWLTDNSERFQQRLINGIGYVIECYNDKFKDGNQPDSIVEIWIPLYRFCESCDMPMTKPEDISENYNYCCHCYGNKDVTLDKLIEDIQKLIKIETNHPNLLSTSLLEYIKNWLKLDDTDKITAIPILHTELIDGQDCDFTGTVWETEWLADNKVCHCIACIAARKCISDICIKFN